MLYAIITQEVLDANVSDLAIRLYAEIYMCNVQRVYFITDKALSMRINKSVVTVNRAVSELQKAALIHVDTKENRRRLTVRRTLEEKIVEEFKYNTLQGMPDNVREFIQNGFKRPGE